MPLLYCLNHKKLMMTNERCPICFNMSLKCTTDENERTHGHCSDCGFNTNHFANFTADEHAEYQRYLDSEQARFEHERSEREREQEDAWLEAAYEERTELPEE